MQNLTWRCHICKKERPDAKISVLTKPIMSAGVEIAKQNIRYCNDNPTCAEAAKTFDFMKKEDEG